MDDVQKAEQLVMALLAADQQIRERVKFHSQLEGGPEQILRRDAYLEVIKVWMRSLDGK